MVRYTVAICNYNMVDTLENSLRSILDQVDDRYEVVVVDGGSDDGSASILHRLGEEYDTLRYEIRDPDPSRHLGADRNRSFELARGDYVLESLDCDNRYFEIVDDFVTLYHQLEPGVDGPFLLSGMGINVLPRELALDVPYRNLGGAEDRDWFRRLVARDAILFLDRCAQHAEQLGYFKGWRWRIERDIAGKICDFRVGITLRSALVWSLHHERHGIYEAEYGPVGRLLKKPYDLVTHLYAYLRSRTGERYETPAPLHRRGELERVVAERRIPAPDLAERLDVDLDPDELSPLGRRVFCLD